MKQPPLPDDAAIMKFLFVASFILVFIVWDLVICFGFIRNDQTTQQQQQQQPVSSRLSEGRQRLHHSMSQVLEKDSWKRAAQFKNLGHRYQQESSQKLHDPLLERKPLVSHKREQFSNRTREDFIFAKLLQRCHGRSHGGQHNHQPQPKCPHGNHWPRGDLWKAWCMQSGFCIPKAVCHKLIKRIGELSSSSSDISPYQPFQCIHRFTILTFTVYSSSPIHAYLS